MISDQNRQAVIDAYLSGRLDGNGRQEVEIKMANEPEFQYEVQYHQALLEHLDDEWRKQTYLQIDQVLLKQEGERDKGKIYPFSFWRQKWVRFAAMIFMVSGLLVIVSYVLLSSSEMSVSLTYYQRNLGMADTVTNEDRTTLPITVITQLWSADAYEIGHKGLRLYLRYLPDDINHWIIRDDPETGGYRLQTPTGTVYKLDRDTQGMRKPL